MDDEESSSGEATPRTARKDRLIQTRVARELEATLKEEARRRRLTVSHLIRNILEDSFHLVDGVVADVDQIVTDSVNLAKNMSRSARRLATAARESEPPPPEPGGDLSHVYAWNEVVLNRSATCSSCGADIERGERGHAGLSDDPGLRKAWLCGHCIDEL